MIYYYTKDTSSGLIYVTIAFLVYVIYLFTDSVLNLNKKAYTDTKTKLYNSSRWDEYIKMNSSDNAPLGVMMFDINGLKYANDTYGHKAGDKIIIKFSEILRNTFDESEFVCRWGGDEFAAIVKNADENGKASITVYMKHSDCAKFIYLPENCIYTIQADDESAEGFSVRGEVSSKMLRAPDEGTTVNEHIIFYKASQTSLIKENEWYNGITDSSDPLLITKNSSFTLQVETKYTPNIYEDLSASLYFYNSDGISTDFVDKTRILMIDMTDEQNPGYYSYIVNGSVSEIPLTEFTELSTADDKFSLKTGDMFTEKLIFAVDYVGSEDSARSGKYSLVYNDAANELKEATNPAKKTVNIGEDTTSLTAAGNSDKAAAIGPFEINIAISDSRPAVNTTYKESEQSKYAVNLSVENAALPDGAYVLIGGKKYYTDNGYIKISPLTEGEYTFKIYSPVPIELTDGKVTFNVDLLSAVSTSPAIPEKITKTVTFNCVDVALDADITDKVLNPGEVSQMDATLKYVGLDAVKLTVTKKGNDTPIISDYNIPLPASGGNVTLSAENGFSFTAVSGETYIFTFVGYSGGVAVLEDKCCVVGGYIVT